MRLAKLLPFILLFSLVLGIFPAAGASGYTPKAGDQFAYSETIDVTNGAGPTYQGYSDHSVTTGMERMNSVYGNGTVASHYSFTWTFTDSSGNSKNGGNNGNFTWSSVNFLYLKGTDNQTGYTNPKVWFYVDNTTQVGGSFYMLDTLMTVKDRNYGFLLPSTNAYVKTIFAQGSSSYYRNDAYGQFNAQYTWNAYFDPATGYIVGYVWSEHDSNSVGDTFTYTESFAVTSTSYALTPGSAPSNLLLYVIIAVAAAFILMVIIAAAVLIRRSRRLKLPKHAYQQEYRPPMPAPVPQQGIDLTPKQPPAQQIVIKEVVKVNCKYCGALIDSTALTCPICGAPRT
jgi:hypothetical protein